VLLKEGYFRSLTTPPPFTTTTFSTFKSRYDYEDANQSDLHHLHSGLHIRWRHTFSTSPVTLHATALFGLLFRRLGEVVLWHFSLPQPLNYQLDIYGVAKLPGHTYIQRLWPGNRRFFDIYQEHIMTGRIGFVYHYGSFSLLLWG
jgi:hypothetical protein